MTSTKTKQQKKQTRKEEALNKAFDAYKRTMQAMENANAMDNPNEGWPDFLKEYAAFIDAIYEYAEEGASHDPEQLYKEIEGAYQKWKQSEDK